MVFNGFVGALPVALGICFYATTQFYMLFRFKSPEASIFTLFYTILGDTFFDTLYGCYTVNFVFTIFFAIVWLNYGIFVIHQCSLATVEDGYLTQKIRTKCNWLNECDPQDQQRQTHKQRHGLTIPETLRHYNCI